MKIHPKIRKYIDLIKEAGISKIENNEQKVLLLLKENGATKTEAIITIHLGLNINIGELEKIVFPSKVWERESLQDIAYQTFLCLSPLNSWTKLVNQFSHLNLGYDKTTQKLFCRSEASNHSGS